MSLNLRRTTNDNSNVEVSDYTIESLLAELEGELAIAA
jgi:hypothetical protein